MKLTRIAKLLLTACFGLFSFVAMAQNKTVTGKVTDEKGSPISGVSVTAKGATKGGSSTSSDGTFKILVPSGTTTLVFSSVGFTKKEVTVTGATADVTLATSNDQLNDVVVVGYGTAKKKDLTGAVAVVSSKNFNQGPIAGPDQLIQGKVSGLQVIANSGQPGTATTVRIRGNSSVRTDAGQPLYVIDGIPLDGRNARPQLSALGLGSTADVDPLLFVNPNDISSITVLKDASACAIYGSRGANGVIMIETKKGSGAPKVDFNYQIGTSSISKKYGILDAAGYKAALSKYSITTGDFGSAVDAQSAILRKGMSQSVNVAVSGGTEKSNYRLSIGYFGQEGIVTGSDLKKYMANFTGQSKILKDKVTIDYGLKAAQVNENIAPVSENAGFEGSLIGAALQWNPTRSYKLANGDWDQPNGSLNPMALLDAYKDKSNLLNGSGYLAGTVKLTSELDFKISSSVSRQSGQRKSSMQAYINQADILDRGWGFAADNQLTTNVTTTTLNYRKDLSKSIQLNTVAGYEYFKSERKGTSLFGKDFKGMPVDYANILQYASQSTLSISSFQDPAWELQSYFIRPTVTISDKYIITATFRADGSTKFGSSNKYGYFPSFAAGWNISNENFLKNVNWVSNLKLRIGYGITGAQDFPSGASQQQYTFNQQSIAQSNYSNDKLQWEKEKQTNIGLDFSLFNKRVTASVDYFKKDRTNILFNLQAPLPAGNPRVWKNLDCDIINSGIEFGINANLISKKDLNLNVGLNATFMKNQLKNYNGGTILTGVISGQGMSGVRVQKLVDNEAINSFYTKDFAGFDASGNSIFNNSGNSAVFGNPNPTTMLGFNAELSYKKWTFTMNGYGLMGQKIYNNTANAVVGLGNLGKRNVDARFIGTGEAVGNTPAASNRYIEDGSFFRMANMTLNYNIGNIGESLKNVNLFVTGSNLFIITKYSGFDPEVNTNKALDGVASQGIEYTPYPAARSFNAGFRVSF